jgi:hypothetical protein
MILKIFLLKKLAFLTQNDAYVFMTKRIHLCSWIIFKENANFFAENSA